MNFVFSIILGLSLTYSFLKTGSVWADTGIHFGLNIAFGLLYGHNGKEGGGILVISKGNIDSVLNNMIVLSFAVLLFPAYITEERVMKRRERIMFRMLYEYQKNIAFLERKAMFFIRF